MIFKIVESLDYKLFGIYFIAFIPILWGLSSNVIPLKISGLSFGIINQVYGLVLVGLGY